MCFKANAVKFQDRKKIFPLEYALLYAQGHSRAWILPQHALVKKQRNTVKMLIKTYEAKCDSNGGLRVSESVEVATTV